MREIDLTSDDLVAILFALNERERLCLLDSCGVGHLGSHLLIAGIRPSESFEVRDDDPGTTLRLVDQTFGGDRAAIFTISYDFGLKLLGLSSRSDEGDTVEPDIFVALFDALIIHDYDSQRTFLVGHESAYDAIIELLKSDGRGAGSGNTTAPANRVTSNFSRDEYISAVERIRERIRAGDTYQANLTQQLRCTLRESLSPPSVFRRLREEHPAPFAAFITRESSTVVSASPERFFRVRRDRVIETSPIKGTRPRGETQEADDKLRTELVTSEKDRAENTMIVDLMRNDLGRVCEYGSVNVEKLCDLEEHPTLFHLVSTVSGKLRSNVLMSDILTAIFPCGSITGAPKIRTMQIIEDIEPDQRGLSMGAIGIYIPPAWDLSEVGFDTMLDVSVAIRTMVIRDGEAVFNVGGGVVFDSDPEKEFDESLLKAKALIKALDADEF